MIPITFNFGGELIYPEPEVIGTAVMAATSELWGIIILEIAKSLMTYLPVSKMKVMCRYQIDFSSLK